MTETLSNHTTTSVAAWCRVPDAYGTWANPQGQLYHYNQGAEHDKLSLAHRGPWLRLNEADISRVRDHYKKAFENASKGYNELEQGLRDLLGDD